MGDEQYLTYEGAKNLRAELERLKGPERDELAKRLRSAIQMGDLSENADYHAAKESQAFLEGKIQELEFVLKNAVIIEELKSDRGVVTVGTKVTIQEANYPPETYDIVGAKEADPKNGRISNQSPFGSALLGGKEGEEVIAETPAGQISLKILKIE
ncbi:MAG TPA: transcription elongation factor GreA [Anaerolineales bacterium]|nr:transcription elongation factor GreA [Anaerolineales bacterium]